MYDGRVGVAIYSMFGGEIVGVGEIGVCILDTDMDGIGDSEEQNIPASILSSVLPSSPIRPG